MSEGKFSVSGSGGIHPKETPVLRPADLLDLQPGKIYRLHRLRPGEKNPESWEEYEANDFYIEEPINANDRQYLFEGKVRVRVVNPNKDKHTHKGSDFYASYHVTDFGYTMIPGIVGVSDDFKLAKARGTYNNWVEELPTVEPPKSDQ